MEITTTIGSILNRKGSTVWSVSPTNTVFEAISMMAEKNVGALPVLEGDRLVGMISERDYARKVILVGRGSRETAVAEIMSINVKTVSPGDSVQECMQIMTENRVRHVPVIGRRQAHRTDLDRRLRQLDHQRPDRRHRRSGALRHRRLSRLIPSPASPGYKLSSS